MLLQKLKETGKPLVVVLAAGSSVNIETDCDALLNMWYPGEAGGTALARILFGDVSPSGKLPVTFYKTANALPDFTDYSMERRTYRYCDSDNVLYPFGFGLGYSEFECGGLELNGTEAAVVVKNKGSRAAENVLQLYVAADFPFAPRYSLCGFARVALAAGEERRVTIPLSDGAFETVDENGIRAVRKGNYTLYAGFSQPDALSEALSGSAFINVSLSVE